MGGSIGIYSRIRIALLVMMQGVTVKYDSSVLWYVSSLVSEVLRCAMGVAIQMEHEHAALSIRIEWSKSCYCLMCSRIPL